MEKDSCLYYAQNVSDGFNRIKGNPGKDIDQGVVYTLLYQAYQLQNQQDSTFKYLQLAFHANDSISDEKILNLSSYQNLSFDEQVRLQKLEKEKIHFKAKMRMYALLAGLSVFLIIALILFRNNRQKQKSNKILLSTLENLKSTQAQLIQSEKMASLGELTAGIAHEIQNPLNFVNNFSEVSKELLQEMEAELDAGNSGEAKNLAKDVIQNLDKINFHGKRADSIVKGMLMHSRTSSGKKEPTDLNALVDEYLRLSYHGLRAKDKTFNAEFNTELDPTLPKIEVVPQDVGRVILNLINNAFYACTVRVHLAKSEQQIANSVNYKPTVTVSTRNLGNTIEIRVKDNGNGIPQHVLDKIFQPFFTTKPTGQGTGLGLSLSYDIVKAHGGELDVASVENNGTEFIIRLPL
jgi:signal transduction histidine kinase